MEAMNGIGVTRTLADGFVTEAIAIAQVLP